MGVRVISESGLCAPALPVEGNRRRMRTSRQRVAWVAGLRVAAVGGAGHLGGVERDGLRHRHTLRAIQGVRAFFLDTPPVAAGVGGADSVGHGARALRARQVGRESDHRHPLSRLPAPGAKCARSLTIATFKAELVA